MLTLVKKSMTATSTEVQKLIPLQLDLGNLAAFDLDPLDETISR